MAKGYLLLRNNKQTGPHNFDELIQLQLKPFDLVWAEGKSAAWRYPGEIEELKAFVPELETLPQHEVSNAITKKYTEQEVNNFIERSPKAIPSSAKHIHVSLPVNKQSYAQPVPPTSYAIPENKAEDLKIYNEPTIKTQHVQPALENKYARSLNDVEEDYTNWVFKQKTKKKNFYQSKNFSAALLVLTVISIGYFAIQLMVSKTPLPVSNPATQSQQQSSLPLSQINENENISPVTTSAISKHSSKKIKTPVEKKPAINLKKPQQKIQGVKSKPIETIAAKKDNVEIKNSDPVIAEKKQDPVSQQKQAPKEKKKLRDVLKGVIDKFKNKKIEVKNDPPITEDPKPSIDRKATHREEPISSTENNIDASALADQIDITGNTPGDGWMMGVTGLKVTLRNRSNFILKTAAVEVLYFDENNKLLEKKTIIFNNVPAKSKQTVAAPDQKFTDHTEYKLGTVSIKDDRFAKQ